jgi:hypothetical protein
MAEERMRCNQAGDRLGLGFLAGCRSAVAGAFSSAFSVARVKHVLSFDHSTTLQLFHVSYRKSHTLTKLTNIHISTVDKSDYTIFHVQILNSSINRSTKPNRKQHALPPPTHPLSNGISLPTKPPFTYRSTTTTRTQQYPRRSLPRPPTLRLPSNRHPSSRSFCTLSSLALPHARLGTSQSRSRGLLDFTNGARLENA